MSKIYEALLRAEKDRAELPPASPSASPTAVTYAEPEPPALPPEPVLAAAPPISTAPTVKLAQPQPFKNRTTPSVYVTQPAPASMPAIANTPAAADDTVNLDKVPVRTWSPVWNLLPALQERGSAVEQFRSLRSRMFEFRDLNKLKSLMVSSGLPQEGKSYITANLALSFAIHKASRVLLIDGDMRRSSLHKMLGAPNDLGLAEYLSGKATLMEVMQRAHLLEGDNRQHAGLESLTFISGGNDSEKAADLSGNRRFDHLIATLAPLFDWIVVDSSPVNLVADGVNLARACDGVLLIARGGVTRFQTAQRALAELKASRILGFVLNAVENPPVSGGYYGYDNYDAKVLQPEPDGQ